jgi:DNA-binding NarL/FixJ family response regulator
MAKHRTAKVLIADDHALVRAGLGALLGGLENVDIVGAAADGREAVAMAARLEPDVVLMDLSIPYLDGVEATRQIVALLPATHVVVLCSRADEHRLTEALAAGAAGYLVKDCQTQEIITAVTRAATGGDFVSSREAGTNGETRAPNMDGPPGQRHSPHPWPSGRDFPSASLTDPA